MHSRTKSIILVIYLTLLEACTKLADWRSVIHYLLKLRSSVGRLPSCLCGGTTNTFGCSPYRRKTRL